MSMDEFAEYLARISKGYPIQNKTGLTGRYDFSLPWIEDGRDLSTESLTSLPVSPIGLAPRRSAALH
ncbi:DUF3738 domain-containing protein [Terriglobus roseus]|uniref:DUF3738 domain-containing protein n=1 Tax=Terriglobus roseus TaxID=392734 RepID=UPI0009F4D395